VAIDTIETLLAVFRRMQLFAPDQIEEIQRELLPHFRDPQALAEHLVQIEWLTPYQCQTLFSGNWDLLSVGPYTLLGRLGSGGVSEVYKAWDTVRGRVVALKVLRQQLAAQGGAVKQFQREREALVRLNHPNVIRTYDSKRAGDLDYFAMEFVEGMDLEDYVRQVGPLPVDQAADYIRQVAQGLQHAHQYGLIHRDIKPANLFLINPPQPNSTVRRVGDPLIKIIDWGLARIRPTEGDGTGPRSVESIAEKGVLLGTADYISPEQARDATVVDTRSDIYSLGCVFAFLLTRKPPFEGKTLMQKLLQHQQAPPPTLRELRPDLPEELEHIVHKMMAKELLDRIQIPLLVVSSLRKFGPSAAAGSVIRTPSSWLRPAMSGTKPVAAKIIPRPEAHAPGRPPTGSGTQRL
jgi:serine/threonine-protein kinase